MNSNRGPAQGSSRTHRGNALRAGSAFLHFTSLPSAELLLSCWPSSLLPDHFFDGRRTHDSIYRGLRHTKASAYVLFGMPVPPTISIFTQAAILASDKYLVPIKPDPLSVVGLPLLERWLDEYTDDAGIKVAPVGLVLTLVRGPLPAAKEDAMNELRRERKAEVFKAHLSQATDVARSVISHDPIFQYKWSSKASQQVQAITNEFVARTSGV